MADKVIGIKIVLEGDQAVSDLDKELIKVTKDLKQLREEQKALNKELQGVDKNSKAYDDLIKKEIELKRQIKQVTEEQKDLNKTFEYTKTAAGSYNELSAELRQLTKDFKALSEAEREGDIGKNTAQRINEVKDKLKEIDKGIGDNFRNVGNYTESINQSFAGVKAQFSEFKSGFKDAFSGFAAAGAGAMAASFLIDFVKGSVSAFNEAEQAAAKLENIIVNIGGQSQAALERLQAQADKLELATFGFTAEQIQELQGGLSLLNLTAEQVEELTPLVLDYAAATGKDLAQATEAVKNALNGKTEALEKDGIYLDKNNISVETLTESFRKFEGSAGRALDVGTNKTEILTDLLGQLQESIGGVIGRALVSLVNIFDRFRKIADTLAGSLGWISDELGFVSVGFAAMRNGAQFVIAPVLSLIEVMDKATNAVSNFLGVQTGIGKRGGTSGAKNDELRKRIEEENKKAEEDAKRLENERKRNESNTITKQTTEQAAAVQVVADSYDGLNKQLSELRDNYQKLSESQRKGAEGQNIIQQTVQIKQQIDIINAEIKNAEVQAEQEKREAIKQEKYKTFGEIKKLNELYESEGVQSIETNTTKQIETIFKESEKIIAANNKAAEEQYQAEQETRAKIETAKNELQAQVFDMALLLSKAYEDSRLQQIQEAYNAENEALKLALDKKKITQEQYNAEKEANDKELAEKEIAIRKKLAAVTKTITIAEIAINLAKELSQINSNVGVNADLTQTLRIVLTAAAVGRAALQTATVLAQKFAKGGIINGASHDNGGVRGYISGQEIELEGGEAVINKRSTAMFAPLLSQINAVGGGKKFAAGGLIPYAYTGQSTMNPDKFLSLIQAVNARIDRLQVINSVNDLTGIQNNQKKLYNNSRI